MWKYSWAHSSLEHILINQKLFSLYDSLILILRAKKKDTRSVCEMLTDLKGPALESDKKAHQIRWKIEPINYLLNYVHTSDNIEDFMREIGILLNWDELIQALETIKSNRIISYPNIEVPTLSKQNYTLTNWLNNIFTRMENSNLSTSSKKYIIKNAKNIMDNTGQKITLNFLCLLCKHELIEWNFETIVVLSNNINYLE